MNLDFLMDQSVSGIYSYIENIIVIVIIAGFTVGLPCSCCSCCLVTKFMSDSVQPHRRQPTRLPHPWDSPGKNTGVGCHFLLQCMKVKKKWKWSRSVVSDSQRPHGLQPTRLLHPWDFPGKSTGVGCHCLLHEQENTKANARCTSLSVFLLSCSVVPNSLLSHEL